MDAPQAPTPPDPAAVAKAQTGYNVDAARTTAALSRYNQITPYGSLTWSNDKQFDQNAYDKAMQAWQAGQGGAAAPAPASGGTSFYGEGDPRNGAASGGANADAGGAAGGTAPDRNNFYIGGDSWTSKVTLDPRVQGLVDAYLGNSTDLQGSVKNALGQVNSVFSKPIDYSALPAAGSAQGSLNEARSHYTNFDPQVQGAANLAGQGQGLASQAMSQWQSGMKPLSYDGVAPMWQPNDQTRQQVIDSLYGQYQRTLDPRFSQEENALKSTLMNRGITEGSEAWNTALANFAREKNDAYNQAGTSSITGATDQMKALAAMGLGARQEGVSEANALWQAPQTQAMNAMQTSNSGASQLGNLSNAQAQQQDSIYRNANTGFGMQNTERASALNEQERERSMALQWLASLRSGTMPQMPDFQAPSGPNVQPANYQGAAYNTYNGQMQQYNADVGSNNAFLAMLGQIGGAGLPLMFG